MLKKLKNYKKGEEVKKSASSKKTKPKSTKAKSLVKKIKKS